MTRSRFRLLALPIVLLHAQAASMAAPQEQFSWLRFRASLDTAWTYQCSYDGQKRVPRTINYRLNLADGAIDATWVGGGFLGGSSGQVKGRFTTADGNASGTAENELGSFKWEGSFRRDDQKRISGGGSITATKLVDEKWSCAGSWGVVGGKDDTQPVNIKLTADKADSMIVPADEGSILPVLRNDSDQEINDVTVTLSSGMPNVFYLFNDPNGTTNLRQPSGMPIERKIASVPSHFSIDLKPFFFQIADEQTKEIFDNVIDPKSATKGILLAKAIKAKVSARGLEKPVELDLDLLKPDAQTVWKITYPDFAVLTGPEPASEERGSGTEFFPTLDNKESRNYPTSSDQLKYYKTGDPEWSHPDNAEVRRQAVAAARYNRVTRPLGPFPHDPQRVIENAAKFIRDYLEPKDDHKDGAKIRNDISLAQLISARTLQPADYYRDTCPANTECFVCQEHGFFFTSLARALGFFAREVQVVLVKDPTPNRDNYYQEAATAIWFGKKWNFYDVFINKTKLLTGPEQYDEKYPIVHIWYGVGRYASYMGNGQNRFGPFLAASVFKPEDKKLIPLDTEAWRYGGPMRGAKEWVQFLAHSPIRTYYVDPNGKRVGAIGDLRPADYQRYVAGESLPSVASEIPGAIYVPPGLEVRPLPNDPEFKNVLEEAIYIPRDAVTNLKGSKLVINGTGSGEYHIDVNVIDARGESHAIESFSGMASPGKVDEHLFKADVPLTFTISSTQPGEDELHLRSGAAVRGRVLQGDNNTISFRTADGIKSYPRDDVSSITLSPDVDKPGPGADFDEWKLDEGRGTTANNATRPDRNGTLINGPSWTEGKVGGSISFNGADGYVNVPAALPTPDQEGTITFWFSLPLDLSGITSLHQNAIEGLAKDGPEGGHVVVGFNQSSMYSGSYALEFGIHNGQDWAYLKSSTERWAANTWYHVAVTWGSAGMKIYINGALENSSADRRLPAGFGSNFRIGQNSSFKANGQGGAWYGRIDDVRVYGRAISDTEVRAIYAQQ
jgi:hypothetical protein